MHAEFRFLRFFIVIRFLETFYLQMWTLFYIHNFECRVRMWLLKKIGLLVKTFKISSIQVNKKHWRYFFLNLFILWDLFIRPTRNKFIIEILSFDLHLDLSCDSQDRWKCTNLGWLASSEFLAARKHDGLFHSCSTLRGRQEFLRRARLLGRKSSDCVNCRRLVCDFMTWISLTHEEEKMSCEVLRN